MPNAIQHLLVQFLEHPLFNMIGDGSPAPEKLETKRGHTNKDSFPNLFVKKFQVNAFVLQPTMYISPTVSCNREDNSALLFC